ncbi:uncharacterized protein BXZ73DRAFT_109963 [Epithele typhae]|uniref:uncharacterized protein n=1 Tax=Epithele typhae TaxID=378194 RepID=UPI002008585B|nr:uncharacterized protein BXZ73DRAFT_109963 [Epithele typhae]KAH9908239.1 hypothetical protein BXZ73DRAFT_109963 [Epithele typhae]
MPGPHFSAPRVATPNRFAALEGASDYPLKRSWLRASEQGWDNDQLDGYFEGKRSAKAVDEDTSYIWFKKMRSVMKEVDHASGQLIPSWGHFTFLDIGCAPGGFSSYILRKNRNALGTGITLPVSQGGPPMQLEEQFHQRYRLIEQDVLELDLSLGRTPLPAPLDPVPVFLHNHFNLVLIDGHTPHSYQPRTRGPTPSPSSPQSSPAVDPRAEDPPRASHDALLLSSLLLALDSLRHGGTLLLFLLDRLADQLVVHKPRALHTTRACFYAVARGVRLNRARDGWIRALRGVWHYVRFDGADRGSRAMGEGELDCIVGAGECSGGGSTGG